MESGPLCAKTLPALTSTRQRAAPRTTVPAGTPSGVRDWLRRRRRIAAHRARPSRAPCVSPARGHEGAAMRETVLTADAGRKLTITTGGQGTEALDAGGRVVGSYGSDRHDELVEQHRNEGWRVVEDGNVAPAQVA